MPPPTESPAAEIRRTRRTPVLGGVRPLPATAHPLVPNAVIEASEAYARALERIAATRAEVEQAEAAVDAAREEDKRAARSAIAADEAPPSPTEPQAAAKLAIAKRSGPAVGSLAREAQNAYLTQLVRHRDRILEAASEEIAKQNDTAAVALDDLEGALYRRLTLRGLKKALDDPRYLEGRSVMFAVREDHRSVEGAELIEGLRALTAAD